MPSCVVRFCKNNTTSQKKYQGVTFHRFPSQNEPWKNDWVEIIRSCRGEHDWNPSSSSVICSAHFEDNDLYLTKNGYSRVVTYAVPKKLLFKQPKVSQEETVQPIVPYGFEEVLFQLPKVKQEETAEPNLQELPFQPLDVKEEYIQPANIKEEHIEPPHAELNEKNKSNGLQEIPIIRLAANLVQPVSQSTDLNTPEVAVISHVQPVTRGTNLHKPQVPPPMMGAVTNNPEKSIDIIRKWTLEQALTKKQKIIERNKIKIKTLNQKIRRLQKRNRSLIDKLKTLKKQNSSDTDLCNR